MPWRYVVDVHEKGVKPVSQDWPYPMLPSRCDGPFETKPLAQGHADRITATTEDHAYVRRVSIKTA